MESPARFQTSFDQANSRPVQPLSYRPGQGQDSFQVSAFHREYSSALRVVQNQAHGRLYLSDLLSCLNFLDLDCQPRLCELLDQQRPQLLITNFNDDVSKNLFQVLCSIIKLQPVSRGYNTLEPMLLTTFL